MNAVTSMLKHYQLLLAVSLFFTTAAHAQEIPVLINRDEKFAGKAFPHYFNSIIVPVTPIERSKNLVLKNDSLVIEHKTGFVYWPFYIKAKIKARRYTVKVFERNRQIGVFTIQMEQKPLRPSVFLTGTGGEGMEVMPRGLTNLTCKDNGYLQQPWKIVSYLAVFSAGEKYYTVRMNGSDQFPEKAKEFYGTLTLNARIFIKNLTVMDDDSTIYNVGDYQVFPELKKL